MELHYWSQRLRRIFFIFDIQILSYDIQAKVYFRISITILGLNFGFMLYKPEW